ncbi:MAG: hypothetical protein NTX75_09845 [Proteobacteria bacterium]|nr:hypothetical protein [Pseudomonadota bacterium]
MYSIDSSDANGREDMKERDRAWDMLKDMPIMMDSRQGQPAQPAAGK